MASGRPPRQVANSEHVTTNTARPIPTFAQQNRPTSWRLCYLVNAGSLADDDHIPCATGFHHCAIAELVIRKYEKAGPTSVQAHTLVAE